MALPDYDNWWNKIKVSVGILNPMLDSLSESFMGKLCQENHKTYSFKGIKLLGGLPEEDMIVASSELPKLFSVLNQETGEFEEVQCVSISTNLITLKLDKHNITSDNTAKFNTTKQEVMVMTESSAVMDKAPSEALMETNENAGSTVVESNDLIIDTVSAVEHLSKAEGIKRINAILNNVDGEYFHLGGCLAVSQKEGWWKDDYVSFREFIESEFGMNYRKAMYLITIYNGLVESGISWDKVKHLGWTKLKELASVLTEENAEEWIDKATDCTVIQLIEAIKIATTGTLESTDQPDETKTNVSTMTFKVHEDQRETIDSAVAKAKEEAETEFSAVALDAICMSYLSGGATAKPASLSSLMKALSPEEVLETFAEVWPDIDITASI